MLPKEAGGVLTLTKLVLPTKASRVRVYQASRVFLQCGSGEGLLTKLAGLGSRSRVFMAPWSRSRLRKKPGAEALEKNGALRWSRLKKNEEPEPLEQKARSWSQKKNSRLPSPASYIVWVSCKLVAE